MEKDTYFVAVKVFLQDDKGKLFIFKDRFGDWDIPGGRLRGGDFDATLPEVVARKMKEELGDLVSYELGDPVIFMRHERDEIISGDKREKRRIFAIGYKASYKGGELKLGKNHEKFQWVDLKTFKPEQYFTGGWLKGIEEFQDMYK
jgi:8-oxo-dGTP pyrophosphatase MutT (NUDIX family)